MRILEKKLAIDHLHQKKLTLMGNYFEIRVIHPDTDFAAACINEAINEIRRIEALLSTFKEDSQCNQINRQAGIGPVSVDREVFQLIHRSLKISELTQGAFDISYGSIDKDFWNFDRSMTALPDAKKLKNSVRLINYKNVYLDHDQCTVFLKEKSMRIGFGGIGKGYAADRAKHLLQAKKMLSGVVNAAGDLITWGMRPDGLPWTIGIADPDTKTIPFAHLNVSDWAVATSGNYEKYVVIDGKKYAHTIDPKTGFPVSGIKSVTILAPSAELADAMATPIMVMGVEAGLYLINQMKNVECIIIDDHHQVYTSNNINLGMLQE